ncbi:MAG: Tn3 family transposase [Cyanobacteria bacterium J06642_3]
MAHGGNPAGRKRPSRDMRQTFAFVATLACFAGCTALSRFDDWQAFGLREQEKRLKYLDLVASAVILQNTVDMTGVIRSLSAEGFKINRRMLATMSLYINRNLKRYGYYVVNLKNIPQPFDGAINLPVKIFESHTE